MQGVEDTVIVCVVLKDPLKESCIIVARLVEGPASVLA